MNTPFYSCIFDKSITDSYCWTISKNNYFIVGGAFPVNNCNIRFKMLKEKIENMGVTFGELEKREGSFINLIKGIVSVCTGKNRAYLIGEAAGMISPSSLEGISYSMESAKILAEIINHDCNNIKSKYFINSLGIRIRLLLKIFKMPFMYNRILRKLLMKSGLKTLKRQASDSYPGL
jgi:flavin-dependent dehydrogenase